MTYSTSGTNYIDALLWGFSWTGSTGQPATGTHNITYGIYPQISATELTQVQAAMKTWSNVANITFTNQGSDLTSDVTFAQQDLGTGVLGYTVVNYSGTTTTKARVYVDDMFTTASSMAPGSLGFLTLMHEIGHALGLEHPGDYGQGEQAPHLPPADDHLSATVMSYYDKTYGKNTPIDETVNPPRTPMIYDIAAIQHIYGANTAYNSGNTTYTYTGANRVETLWDGGGIDTITASSMTASVRLDLREGVYYYSKIGSSYVWNAFNSHIENATGGSGNDTLIGNNLANALIGNNGADMFTGYGGADTIQGGAGNDTVRGDNTTAISSDGADYILGHAGADLLYGGGNNDRVYGGTENDTIYGEAGNDKLVGDSGADKIYAGAGNDVIYGDQENSAGTGGDTLYGEAGNDTIYGGADNDLFIGGANNDVMTGNAGNDTFWFTAGSGLDTIRDFAGEGVAGGDIIRVAAHLNGNAYTTAAQYAAHVTYAGSVATLNLGGGNIITIQGVTAHLIASDFLIG